MKKAVSLKEYKTKRTSNYDTINECVFICYNGVCSVETTKEIAGIQIEFYGKGNIMPKVPEGWVFRGLENKIVIFSLDRKVLNSGILFTYIGNVRLKSVIVCDHNAKLIRSTIDKQYSSWDTLSWNWEDHEIKYVALIDKQNKLRLTKTKYNMKADIALKAKEGEFYIGDKPYTGSYHIPHDTNIPMSGARFNKNSKPLSKTPVATKDTKINTKTSTNTQGGY